MKSVLPFLRRNPWWVAALLPAATALFYAFYTHQMWEDYLITLRHTENFVNGRGLVYQPGERVHGFTSVLNTLLPALPLAITHSVGATLWCFRLCSLAVLLWGMCVLWRATAEKLGAGRFELWLNAILTATTLKIIAFTMNGQETGLVVGFFAMSLGYVLRLDEPRAWLRLGLAWAGLLYTRPDSPLYIAVVAVVAWQGTQGNPRTKLPPLAKAGALAVACILPWVLTAWLYYGSPVPHTVTAKAGESVLVAGNIMATLSAMCSGIVEIGVSVFGANYGMADWPQLLGLGVFLAAAFASTWWLRRWHDRFAATCSLGMLGLLVYMLWLKTQRDAYPWYFGPIALLGIVVLTRTLGSLWEGRTGRTRGFALAIGSALVVVTGTVFIRSLETARIQQVEVEDNTRKQIGLWLKANAAPGDTVYLEPFGYIGYYSGLKILDYPGLVAPEVVKARREHHASFAELPVYLKPTWIVVRPGEFDSIRQVADIAKSYVVTNVWDHTQDMIAKYGQFPGGTTVLFDSEFVALHRKPDAP